MCDKLVPPAQLDIPVNTGSPNLLQLTSATFLVPGALCVLQGKLVGVVIHCGNAVCSVYVHRPDRTQKDNWADVVDHILVFAWVLYNAHLLFKDPTPPLYVPAVVCAGVVLAAKIWTRHLEYRTLSRYAVHTCMHLFGTLGSTFLLLK